MFPWWVSGAVFRRLLFFIPRVSVIIVRMHYRIPAKCLLYGVFLTLPCLAFAEVLTGRVIRVADGDTVTDLDHWKAQHKIRLQGIDAPERGLP